MVLLCALFTLASSMPDLFTLIFLPYHIAQITLAGIHAYSFFLRVISQASMSLMAYLPGYNTRHKIAPDNGTENEIVHLRVYKKVLKEERYLIDHYKRN